ncbi:hypothetical protein L208DRAFT_1527662, partial [Tricholoma matsutake]
QYHLPYHKSDPFYCGTDVILTKQDVANPVALLWEYVSWRDRLHGARSALFLWENGLHPSRSWFDLKFFTILDCRYGGHSPRTGYTTLLASLGLSESIMQAVGRWSSDAWKIYIFLACLLPCLYIKIRSQPRRTLFSAKLSQLEYAAEVIVEVGSKGKEHIRRPLHQKSL